MLKASHFGTMSSCYVNFKGYLLREGSTKAKGTGLSFQRNFERTKPVKLQSTWKAQFIHSTSSTSTSDSHEHSHALLNFILRPLNCSPFSFNKFSSLISLLFPKGGLHLFSLYFCSRGPFVAYLLSLLPSFFFFSSVSSTPLGFEKCGVV